MRSSDTKPSDYRDNNMAANDFDLLSEDGEARRRFLKHALVVGGGLAAANLLHEYQASARAELPAATVPPVPSTLSVRLRVNGRDYPLQIDPQTTLLDALRERIGLTGSKKDAIGDSAAPVRCWQTGGA